MNRSSKFASAFLTATLAAQSQVGLPSLPPAPTLPAPPRQIKVAFIGDSYAAGEGSPNTTGARWNSVPCHRSNENGRHDAAVALQQSFGVAMNLVTRQLVPRMIFTDVACSGATINGSLIGSGYRGVMPMRPEGPGPLNPPMPSQVDQVRTWLDANGGGDLDALVLTVGGNDVGFIDVVKKCMMPLTTCRNDSDLTGIIRNGKRNDVEVVGLNNLAAAYGALKAEIDAKLKARTIYVVGYTNPLHDQDGRFCDRFEDGMGMMGNPFDPFSPIFPMVGLSTIGTASPAEFDKAEARWVEDNLINPLNDELADIVSGFSGAGWKFIDLRFMTSLHGFCSSDAWINTPRRSFEKQGDFNGTAHPNAKGYQVYEAFVHRALLRHFDLRVTGQPRIDNENFHVVYTLDGETRVVTPGEFEGNLVDRLRVGDNWSLRFRSLVFPAANHLEQLTLQVSTRSFDTASAGDIQNFDADVSTQQTGNFNRTVSTRDFPNGTTLHVRWRVRSRPHWDPGATVSTRFSGEVTLKIKDGLDLIRKL